MKDVLSGIGDGAFIGPQSAKDFTVLGFRKGTRAVRLNSTSIGKDGSRTVTGAQLKEIAELVASRID